jgi:arylsulfatase A-like enzyme
MLRTVDSDGGCADRVLVIVVDGLRPDAVTPTATPNLDALRRDGVECTAAHAVVPPVTRVNAATLATGRLPSATGITGNSMYVPEVDRGAAFNTADARNLYRLGDATGAIVETTTLAERLADRGRRFVAIGSGSSGATLCLNPRAPLGVGVMINAGDPGTGAPFAFPERVGEAVLERFGAPPRRGQTATDNRSVDYVTRVFTDYVLTDLEADVALLWLTEPDGTQHRRGVGSAAALEAIRNVDRNLGVLLDRLQQLGVADRTTLLVVSDHGFAPAGAAVDLTGRLVDAGLKRHHLSSDVVVASTGSAGIFVEDRDRLRQIVAFLAGERWVEALFTAAPSDGGLRESAQGWVEGTFALDAIGLGRTARSPDILVTFAHEHDRAGVARFIGSPGSSRPKAADHGNLSAVDIGTTFIAWGWGIRRGTVSALPIGNLDITPTVLALLGLADGLEALDGRVAHELLVHGDPPAAPARTATFTTRSSDGAYRAALRTVSVDGTRYVKGAGRLPAV